jgi:hypothetical protein
MASAKNSVVVKSIPPDRSGSACEYSAGNGGGADIGELHGSERAGPHEPRSRGYAGILHAAAETPAHEVCHGFEVGACNLCERCIRERWTVWRLNENKGRLCGPR